MQSPPFRRRRAKIGGAQPPSDETLVHAAALHWQEIGPGALAVGEWQARGMRLPDLNVIRRYRLQRVRDQLRRFDYMGAVLYDPLNIRYATDSTNMQVWILHNNNRYCYVPQEGPVIVFDYEGAEHLNAHLDLVDEIRTAKPWFFMSVGERYPEKVEIWADELADLVRSHGGGNKRLAIDRCNPEGLRALEKRAVDVRNGEEIMELARVIKCDEEIVAMRCATAACESAIAHMRDALTPGISEQDLWAHLHAENIRRGGEWIETRLLAAGPRTNPWFQECSSRPIQDGELVGFDTDLIGAYGMCVDVSRTWLCGDGRPSAAQRQLWEMAAEQIERNTEILQPGASWRDLTFRAHNIAPDRYRRYSCFHHGVGLADEYPGICFPDEWDAIGLEGVLEPGMVLCVESYVADIGGGEGVKLEEQVVVTATGYEKLSTYPLGLC